MSQLVKKAQDHLAGAEVVREDPKAAASLLRWSVAYALVATAEGVWKIVEILREVHPSEAARIQYRDEKKITP